MAGMLKVLYSLLFLLVGLQGELKETTPTNQPRILADNGHLVFTTGDSKDIRFQASGSGRVKVGDEDLSQLLIQIKTNKDDIDKIKADGGTIPPEISNHLNKLDTQVSSVESKVTALEQVDTSDTFASLQ